ncbi:polysaccharide deacetylase family protein [Pseudofrankia asymbiotica]|uniref:NodB homology domain-containing protein n=1 Tax=Pseudofrankia asymbiotica TaxID=1834516 RepID=A0A1V2I181_9ACTN|nr:polysaccharide deacetylase family protein [Pseudofrankia asymbiotica]ONH21989.1 hypothetical protein BL253_37055 [Pseudofrankia asymbiotica]
MVTRRGLLAGTAAAALTACSAPAADPASPAAGSAPATRGAPAGSATATPPAAVPTGSPSSPGGPAEAVSHGPRDRPQVALTFHLGPHQAGQDLALAHQLLADAARLSAPITVFAVGAWLERHEDLAGPIVAGGNELANHTYTHPTLAVLPADRVAAEIVGCREVLARIAPAQGRYFRPSGGDATSLILAEAGAAGYRTVVGFDVDPLDYTSPGADAVVARVRAGTLPGSVVSMHFGYPGTVGAFPRIIANLRAAGLTPVRLRDLLT